MTIGDLLSRLDSAELSEWMAFYNLEPFGPEAEAYRSSLLAAQIQNYSGFAKKAAQPKDFMPKRDRIQTPEEQLAYVKKQARIWGWKTKDKN